HPPGLQPIADRAIGPAGGTGHEPLAFALERLIVNECPVRRFHVAATTQDSFQLEERLAMVVVDEAEPRRSRVTPKQVWRVVDDQIVITASAKPDALREQGTFALLVFGSRQVELGNCRLAQIELAVEMGVVEACGRLESGMCKGNIPETGAGTECFAERLGAGHP